MYGLRNRVQLIGHLGARPVITEREDGRKMACFNLATTAVCHGCNGEKIRETQWHRMVAWGKIADIAGKYLDKGDEILIEGRLLNRSFTDRQGKRRFISEVRISELIRLQPALSAAE